MTSSNRVDLNLKVKSQGFVNNKSLEQQEKRIDTANTLKQKTREVKTDTKPVRKRHKATPLTITLKEATQSPLYDLTKEELFLAIEGLTLKIQNKYPLLTKREIYGKYFAYSNNPQQSMYQMKSKHRMIDLYLFLAKEHDNLPDYSHMTIGDFKRESKKVLKREKVSQRAVSLYAGYTESYISQAFTNKSRLQVFAVYILLTVDLTESDFKVIRESIEVERQRKLEEARERKRIKKEKIEQRLQEGLEKGGFTS